MATAFGDFPYQLHSQGNHIFGKSLSSLFSRAHFYQPRQSLWVVAASSCFLTEGQRVVRLLFNCHLLAL